MASKILKRLSVGKVHIKQFFSKRKHIIDYNYPSLNHINNISRHAFSDKSNQVNTQSIDGYINNASDDIKNDSQLSSRQRFEMPLIELMDHELPEQENTEAKMPQSVLDELTKEYETPPLTRIGIKELKHIMSFPKYEHLLLPFKSLLSHWTIDDGILKKKLQLSFPNINQVQFEEIIADDKKNYGVKRKEIPFIFDKQNDEKLLNVMETEYLIKYQDNANKLYEIGMQFYDIATIIDENDENDEYDENDENDEYDENATIRSENRLSSIFLTLASKLGHAQAQLQLGKQYMLGYGVAKDHRSAVYYFIHSGAQGNIEARAYLGSMYMTGYGIKKNLHNAFLLLNEASRYGNPQGQRYLAELYEKGEYVEKDYYIALRLAEKAAGASAEKLQKSIENPNLYKIVNPQFVIEAATIAGRMYCLQENIKEGVKFFKKAAKLGDMNAQCNLGHIFYIGAPGVEKNIYSAAKWLWKAAKKGHSRAHRELGMIYAYEDNTPKQNTQKALTYLYKAAIGGYIDCYLRLAEIYATGNKRYPGIRQNFAIARQYINITHQKSNLSKSSKDKLPENVWQRMKEDPLTIRTLIDTYEKITGGRWTGTLGDLNPETLRKIVGVDIDNMQ